MRDAVSSRRTRLTLRLFLSCGAALLLLSPTARSAQQGPVASGAGGAPKPPPGAKAQAPFDLTGYWVSLITENWRFRMIVPGKGEYADVPINIQSKQFADAWSRQKDEEAGKQCEAYGAAIIMRNPERLHITWQDENTLRVETDEGMQTRLLHFIQPPAADDAAEHLRAQPTDEPRSWQGHSLSRWVLAGGPGPQAAQGGGPRSGAGYGSLEVATTNLLPGLLRKNGLPYSEQAQSTEIWDLRKLGEQQWISVSVTVNDPQYLQVPYRYDAVFQKEPDDSKWSPSPCSLSS